MGDTNPSKPDYDCLFAVASSQHGYFTAAQARVCGFGWERLSNTTRTGRFIRIHRGIYRLRDYPDYPREEVVSAWLAIGKETSVVSHESALDLLQLSDVIPNYIHITVPRSRRNLPNLPGVKIHTTTRQLGPMDVVVRDGMRVTSAIRTILDTAEAGTAPEQIEMAIRQALARGMVTRAQLAEGASHRNSRVQRLITGALE
jgi:predicted transcriptional regulator of viral defense system